MCLYIMIEYGDGPHFGSLYEFNICKQDYFRPLAQFRDEDVSLPLSWKFCSLDTNNICLLPDSGPLAPDDVVNPLSGYMFNVDTNKCHLIKPPVAPKWEGPVVSACGKLYSITDPYYSFDVPEPSFERYDPYRCCWETRKSFPYGKNCSEQRIGGHAVCDGLILYNIIIPGDNPFFFSRKYQDEMWAYDVTLDEWLPVRVENTDCYSFRGPAVCVDKTIYALSSSLAVMALSITRHENLVTCSLKSQFVCPEFGNFRPGVQRMERLIYLGDLNFCLVQTGFHYDSRSSQSLKITTFHLVGETNIKIERSFIYEVPLEGHKRFTIGHCFIHTFERIELEELASRIDFLNQEYRFGLHTEFFIKPVDFIFKPEYDYLEIDQPNYANIEEENISLQGGPHFKNFVDLLKDLLAMALANGLLRRGIPTASNLIPDQKVWLCVFAEDSNQDDVVKAVKSLCEGYHVKYLTIASAKTLGQWSLSGNKDSEGKAKRVVRCSCVVIEEGIYETELHKAVLEVWKSLPSKLEVLEESGQCRPVVGSRASLDSP
ncbi:uncharacterized protein LOC121052922 [Rosa chinensis]|nr:uncharacterized protein LOC121052922 [Rosa chinensis]